LAIPLKMLFFGDFDNWREIRGAGKIRAEDCRGRKRRKHAGKVLDGINEVYEMVRQVELGKSVAFKILLILLILSKKL